MVGSLPRRGGCDAPRRVILVAIAAIAAAYQVFALLACVLFRTGQRPGARGQGPVSVLKPVRGLDPAFREAILSHTLLQGEYEFLCGVNDPRDPALAVLSEFSRARVVKSTTQTPNGKVGVLIDLAAVAHYPVLVVNDSDIRVEPDYLARVTAPLADPRVGLVTCLYRPMGDTFAARFEGLGVSTDFAPSALVARLVGVDEFAMGSTLAFRREDLDRIGGFAAIADYLADDYQLGHRIHALGLKCVLSDVIVETHLGGTWRGVWAHQLRWARTIRVSRFGGYLGLPLTNATLWAAVAAAFGRGDLFVMLLVARLAMALTAGGLAMRSRDVLRLWWLVPVRDLFAFAVWLVGLFGNSVTWRGRRLRLDREGRIV
jgi:ceramide glucosyltransferase